MLATRTFAEPAPADPRGKIHGPRIAGPKTCFGRGFAAGGPHVCPRFKEQFVNDKSPSIAGQSTIIGESCRINGDISLDGHAVVLGQVAGRVEVSGDLEIGQTGEVRGPVHVGAMVSRGKIDGPVTCDQSIDLHGSIHGTVACGNAVHIGSTATLVGDLFARAVTIADGATYRGHLVINAQALEEADRVMQSQVEGNAEAVPFNGAFGGAKFNEVKPVTGIVDPTSPETVAGAMRRRSGLLTRTGA
jgi:cytoskeletal protein CcmA (bactofilin family)